VVVVVMMVQEEDEEEEGEDEDEDERKEEDEEDEDEGKTKGVDGVETTTGQVKGHKGRHWHMTGVKRNCQERDSNPC
jgi:hypothetical protein